MLHVAYTIKTNLNKTELPTDVDMNEEEIKDRKSGTVYIISSFTSWLLGRPKRDRLPIQVPII